MLLSPPNAQLPSAFISDDHMASGVVVVVVVVMMVVVVVVVVVMMVVLVVVRLRELKVQMTVGVRNPPRAALL